jgi:hypothetical protein
MDCQPTDSGAYRLGLGKTRYPDKTCLGKAPPLHDYTDNAGLPTPP